MSDDPYRHPLFQTHDQRALDLIRRMRHLQIHPNVNWAPDTLIPLGIVSHMLTIIIGLADLDCVCPIHMVEHCPGHDCDSCPTCLSGEARRLLIRINPEV